MATTSISIDKLWPSSFHDKAVGGYQQLRGGMELNSSTIPVKAKGRDASQTPKLSFAVAMACAKLIAGGEVAEARFVGKDGDSEPCGVCIKTKDKGINIWTILRKSADGTRGALQCLGNPFGTSMFNYYGGIGIASYMMMNYQSYPNFMDSVKEAIEANNTTDDKRKTQAIALMADELCFAIENMINGADPTGVTCVEMAQQEPEDLTEVFKGGENLTGALQSAEGLDKLKKTKVQAVTLQSAIYGDSPVKSNFVGDLPQRLKDLFVRGKHVLLTGPTATGKTTAIDDVIQHLKAPMSYLGGSPGLEDRDMIGCWAENGKGGWEFRYGPLTEALKNGYAQFLKHVQEQQDAQKENREANYIPPAILFVDEINRLDERHQNVFISLLNERPDGNGGKEYYFRIPDNNEAITCPVGFFCVVAARNFGSSYVGTASMDLALERRFHSKIDLSYLDKKNETELLIKRTGIDKKTAEIIAKTSSDTRNQLTQLRAPIDHDTALKWAEELAYIQSKGVPLSYKVILETAKHVVFDIVLERTERGEFDPAGLQVMIDNITESYKEVHKK